MLCVKVVLHHNNQRNSVNSGVPDLEPTIFQGSQALAFSQPHHHQHEPATNTSRACAQWIDLNSIGKQYNKNSSRGSKNIAAVGTVMPVLHSPNVSAFPAIEVFTFFVQQFSPKKSVMVQIGSGHLQVELRSSCCTPRKRHSPASW